MSGLSIEVGEGLGVRVSGGGLFVGDGSAVCVLAGGGWGGGIRGWAAECVVVAVLSIAKRLE